MNRRNFLKNIGIFITAPTMLLVNKPKIPTNNNMPNTRIKNYQNMNILTNVKYKTPQAGHYYIQVSLPNGKILKGFRFCKENETISCFNFNGVWKIT